MKTVYKLWVLTISILVNVRGQSIELCMEQGCCQGCCRAGEDAAGEIPGFLERSGCKNACDNEAQDCSGFATEEQRQSCEVGKAFLVGNPSLFFGTLLCRLQMKLWVLMKLPAACRQGTSPFHPH